MKEKILQSIREGDLIREGMHVVIGLSGGPDSMCLFDVLCRLAPEMGLNLYPVHVNHKFRPGEAEADQAFVETFCEEQGWQCRSFVVDCHELAEEEGLTAEEAGRKARYNAFGQVADEIVMGGVPRELVVIAVAQNANDQCETILFRLLRGTGVDGLAGIAYKRYDERGTAVVRPLLDADRRDIDQYCRQRGLTPRQDHTNQEPTYTRNRIRLELIPYLREGYNPNIQETVNRMGRQAAVDKDYLWQQAEEAYEKACQGATGSKVILSRKVLLGLHPAIRTRVYGRALGEIGIHEDVTATHMAGIDRALKSDSPSASWNLPREAVALRRYETLCFLRGVDQEDKGQSKRMTGTFDLDALCSVYGENAADMITLRTRQSGDYMVISTGGSLHRKKLQDILVDFKVPKQARDQVQVVAIGKEILWILPWRGDGQVKFGEKGRFSAAYRVSDEKNVRRIDLEYLLNL